MDSDNIKSFEKLPFEGEVAAIAVDLHILIGIDGVLRLSQIVTAVQVNVQCFGRGDRKLNPPDII